MKAAIYARYSSDNQREESIDAQIRAITDYAMKNGYTIVCKYIDEAMSAKTDNRPRFLQMIEDSKLNTFDVVICHKLDRFARNRYDSAFYKKLLKDNGVRLISVLENFDDSPESIILESVLEGMAEYYSANLAREVQKGLKENALECKHNGGKPPFGYDVDSSKHYTINNSEATAVKKIYEMIINGHSAGDVVKWLSENGYYTKYGTHFTKSSVNAIIRNEKYKGVYIYGKEKRIIQDGVKKNIAGDNIVRVENGIPIIVDNNIWTEANKIYDSRCYESGGRAYSKESYLLSGKIKCGCGMSMCGTRAYSGRNKSLRVFYKCTGKKIHSGCHEKEIKRDFIESYIIDKLDSIISIMNIDNLVNDICNEADKKNHEIPDLLKSLHADLTATNGQLNNVIELVMNGVKSQTIVDKINELEIKKNSISDKIKYLEQKVNSAKIDRNAVYKYLSMFTSIKKKSDEMKKKAIQIFVKEIIVSNGEINVVWEVPTDNDGSAP